MTRINQSYGLQNPLQDTFPAPVLFTRAPLPRDTQYPLGQMWLDKTTEKFYGLADLGAAGATWVLLSSGTSVLQTLEGDTGGVIGPDGGGTIYIQGAAGTGVTVDGNAGANSLFISVTGAGMTWTDLSSSIALSSNNGYICTAGGALSLSLPASSVFGDLIVVSLDGATSFEITQGAGQQIRFGNQQSTLGATGSLMSTDQGDSLWLVCTIANLRWNVLNSVGNFMVV